MSFKDWKVILCLSILIDLSILVSSFINTLSNPLDKNLYSFGRFGSIGEIPFNRKQIDTKSVKEKDPFILRFTPVTIYGKESTEVSRNEVPLSPKEIESGTKRTKISDKEDSTWKDSSIVDSSFSISNEASISLSRDLYKEVNNLFRNESSAINFSLCFPSFSDLPMITNVLLDAFPPPYIVLKDDEVESTSNITQMNIDPRDTAYIEEEDNLKGTANKKLDLFSSLLALVNTYIYTVSFIEVYLGLLTRIGKRLHLKEHGNFDPMIRKDGNGLSLFFIVLANSKFNEGNELDTKKEKQKTNFTTLPLNQGRRIGQKFSDSHCSFDKEEIAATIEICYRVPNGAIIGNILFPSILNILQRRLLGFFSFRFFSRKNHSSINNTASEEKEIYSFESRENNIFDLDIKTKPYLCNVAVSKNYQRRRLGRTLIQIIEEIVKDVWQDKEIYLHANLDDIASKQLYGSLNYTPLPEYDWPDWYRKLGNYPFIRYHLKKLSSTI